MLSKADAQYGDIHFEQLAGVATITLNRPEKLNAWTPMMGREMRHALERCAQDDAVRVIILTGAGRGFCAGADMNSLSDISDAGESPRGPFEPFDTGTRADFKHPMTYLPSVPKPIIAAVNGPAAGLGLAMLLFCDMRFSSESGAFVTSFARRGLIAEHGTSWMLTRLIGHSRALDLMLSSRKVAAEEALRIGLVDRVFSPEALLAETMAYARQIADLVSPRSTRIIKRQLWNALFEDLSTSMSEADHEMALSLRSEDFKEGVAHFLEKRSPAFKGV